MRQTTEILADRQRRLILARKFSIRHPVTPTLLIVALQAVSHLSGEDIQLGRCVEAACFASSRSVLRNLIPS